MFAERLDTVVYLPLHELARTHAVLTLPHGHSEVRRDMEPCPGIAARPQFPSVALISSSSNPLSLFPAFTIA